MGQLVPVIKKADLMDGEMKVITTSGRDILVARASDNYYAADSRCPHLGGDLGKGKLEGTVVTCPLHGSQFDLADGRVIRWTNFTGFASKVGKLLKSPKPLIVYKVKIEGDQILVEI
jgi:3-phenylpropionate/trans-cinnamate dioxygenase ferredoxin subunit